MHSYRVLGGHLHSELEFPELPAHPADRAATWSFVVAHDASVAAPLEALGSDAVREAGDVRLFRHAGGFRLVYPDTGVYDVTRRGGRIAWHPPATRPYDGEQFLEAVRIDVLGRVLSVAMHAAGIETLHGSAVVLPDGLASAFIAPKFHGKSTLASALVGAGARLITDDTLPVLPGDPLRAGPGVHSVRMWEDSAVRVEAQLAGLEPGPWGKLQSSRLPAASLVHEPVAFAAIYVLAPRRVVDGAPVAAVTRERLVATDAALLLIAHAKLGPLLGKSAAPGLLAWAVRLAQAVPVYRLSFPRDFERLPEVVGRLSEWHTGP